MGKYLNKTKEVVKEKNKLVRDVDFKTLSRSISLIENEAAGYENLLMQLRPSAAIIIGITGAPGAGKSSLTDALIAEMVNDNKRVGVLCVDPSSPFNKGALLGDRIRMSEWYNHPDVFIRSLATRGSLGGLHPKIIEIADFMKSSGFDYIIIETVGVGQSEVDIAGLADITVVMLVPEGGDVIQTMKAGLMEVADLFVVNKFDRPGADIFYNTLKKMLHHGFNFASTDIPVLKTVASSKEGIFELYEQIKNWRFDVNSGKKNDLLANKIWMLIQNRRMRKIDKKKLSKEVGEAASKPDFNMYIFAKNYDTD